MAINGTSGSNTLQGPNQTNAWSRTGANAGSLDTAISFSKIQNLMGGSANDTFAFQTGGSLAGSIAGAGGTGRNIIIGGAGSDQITGGGGDNILIGGTTLWDTNPTALQDIMLANVFPHRPHSRLQPSR